ncbi:hypothetical protein ACHAWC_009178 [Mediolabrus comicus]
MMTTSPNGVDQAQAIAAAAASNNHNDHSKSTTKGVALLLLLTISLLTIFSASNTISSFHYDSSESSTTSSISLSSFIPLVTNYSTSIAFQKVEDYYDHKKLSNAAAEVAAASSSLPIYLIDTSTSLSTNSSNSSDSGTPIVVSTWGEIASQWNRTTEYDNLLSLASTTSLPNSSHNNKQQQQLQQQKRPIILIHCGPKVGSTTLRVACRRNIAQTCPQLLDQQQSGKGHEKRAHAPPGYFGGERLHTVLRECTNTHYFCVNQITMSSEEDDEEEGLVETMMMRSGTEEEEEVDDDYESSSKSKAAATTTTSTTKTRTISSLPNSNITQYIHLFPFRNYNDWVKSAIKQQYDRAGVKGCNSAQRHWEGGKCTHYQMEIDIRKYGRVDLDRFQDGIVKRQINRRSGGTAPRQGGGEDEEEHTFILYLHRDLQKVIEIISSIYNIPMLPGTSSKKKGKRPEGTCNESLVEMYHDCFSDGLMNFRWDLEENMLLD